jgi:hypothetical protein
MTDRQPASSTSPFIKRQLWAVIVALLFSVQAVLTVAPSTPATGDILVASKATRLPAIAHVREAATVVPVIAKGLKSQPGSHGDGTPPFLAAVSYVPVPQVTGGVASLWLTPSSLLRGTRREANRARAPPRLGNLVGVPAVLDHPSLHSDAL